MNLKMSTEIPCQVCGRQESVMKRCTRCQLVYYCSKECQVKDWKEHRLECGKVNRDNDGALHVSLVMQSPSKKKKNQFKDDGSIFQETDDQDSTGDKPKKPFCRPLVDFSKAASPVKEKDNIDHGEKAPSSGKYLFKNEFHSDMPELDTSEPFHEIIVKCNKTKRNIKIQESWDGKAIMKVLSHQLEVPLDKIKVIHKGKIMTSDTIKPTIAKKAVFQVIGEQAANEDGLDKRDIEVMMSQLKIDRNDAVNALRKKGDVIDAILEIGNK